MGTEGGARYIPGPCPVCGKEGGAIMGKTDWGHNVDCCSDECGFAYARSPARARAELSAAREQLDCAKIDVEYWEIRVREWEERGPSTQSPYRKADEL